ncbi:MAG TPA: von Willebrand factor type A domain-containing protein [Thermoanaerobaculia bacterium]|nr:von Willebrand factor type A domain-containing protein [Thermoanaerobaculia bacterium]
MKRALVLVIALVVACTSLPNKPGTVSGTVADGQGNPLPGVTVTLGQQSTVTDPKGHYEFRNVPPGKYELRVQLEGFTEKKMRLAVADKEVRRDAKLSSSVSEAITVAAESPYVVSGGIAGGRVQALQLPAAVPMSNVERPSTAEYAKIAENGFIDTKNEKTTTFSIDVDGASYANVRRFLNANMLPPAEAVRVEEMINYFTYSYPQPSDGRPFSVASEVAGCPWNPNHRLLRVGIQGKTIDQWKLAPNNLVFLLDVSGSMMPPERLPLLKSAFRLLVEQLRPEDSVAIVVYAGAAGVVLPQTSGANKQTILAALDQLQAGGSTAGGAGIELAYKTAEENFATDGNNRVILATDGDFNVGMTGDALINVIEEKRKKGIYLTCIGVGDDNYKDAFMESLADKGNGNYYYLDNINEAKKVFVHQLQGTLVAIAKDVKVQLEFDPRVVTSYRQIGYEDRALANKDFADDTKDAGELGSGHSVTALYEISTTGRGQIAELRLRYKDPHADTSQLITARVVDEGRSIYESSSDLQFATAVAEFGMLLRKSQYKGSATYADVLALARAMRGADLEGYRDEFLRMVETSRTLSGEAPQAIARQ